VRAPTSLHARGSCERGDSGARQEFGALRANWQQKQVGTRSPASRCARRLRVRPGQAEVRVCADARVGGALALEAAPSSTEVTTCYSGGGMGVGVPYLYPTSGALASKTDLVKQGRVADKLTIT
jgi:hypothetical protein